MCGRLKEKVHSAPLYRVYLYDTVYCTYTTHYTQYRIYCVHLYRVELEGADVSLPRGVLAIRDGINTDSTHIAPIR